MINDLPNASNYGSFAYHTALLKDFVKQTGKEGSMRRSATNGTSSGDGTEPKRRHSHMVKRLSMKLNAGRGSSQRSLTGKRGFQSGSAEFGKPGPASLKKAQSVMIKGL